MEQITHTDTTPSKWRQHLTLDLPQAWPDCVWIHACSVGEVASITSLAQHIHQQGQRLHISVVTATGMAHARKRLGNIATISYLPWDLPGLMSRWIKQLQPALLLLTETEFWPGMLRACHHKNIPIIGINTRISDRSFPRYQASYVFWRWCLAPVSLFLAQSQTDAERLKAIGVAHKRIHAVGNLKYAIQPPQVDASHIRKQLDASERRPILLLASTHDDEEKRLLTMLSQWKQQRPDLLTVMVPRHPERFDSVESLIQAAHIPMHRWSHGHAPASCDIVLIDAMGILQQLYTVADIVIIAGSIANIGGHNPLEAAICGRGVITGPHIQNFRAVMQDMQYHAAAVITASDDELCAAVMRMLTHPEELRQLHAQASLFMQDKYQVLETMYQYIEPYLPAPSNGPHHAEHDKRAEHC